MPLRSHSLNPIGHTPIAKGSLPQMSLLAKQAARELGLKNAKDALGNAISEGRWVSFCDASIAHGQSAIAWGIYNPSGALVAQGSRRVTHDFHIDPETQAALTTATMLSQMGASNALMFTDCKPTIRRLVRPNKTDTLPLHSMWLQASQNQYELMWMPRNGMGPANDAARAQLFLSPEKKMVRHWPAQLTVDAFFTPTPATQTKRVRQREAGRFKQALENPNEWIAIISATRCTASPKAAGEAFIYSPKGVLLEHIQLRLTDVKRNDGQLHAYDRLTHHVLAKLAPHNPSAVCVFFDQQSVADRAALTDYKHTLTEVFHSAQKVEIPKLNPQTTLHFTWDPTLELGPIGETVRALNHTPIQSHTPTGFITPHKKATQYWQQWMRTHMQMHMDKPAQPQVSVTHKRGTKSRKHKPSQ